MAGRREKILLREAGGRTEVRATELLERGRLPSAQAVSVGERLDDPGVDRETFQPAETEERDTSRDLGADAG